eukprot:11215752-Lingulodinium_polyedra.AAC.1
MAPGLEPRGRRPSVPPERRPSVPPEALTAMHPSERGEYGNKGVACHTTVACDAANTSQTRCAFRGARRIGGVLLAQRAIRRWSGIAVPQPIVLGGTMDGAVEYQKLKEVGTGDGKSQRHRRCLPAGLGITFALWGGRCPQLELPM